MESKIVNQGCPGDCQIGIEEQKIRFIQHSDTWDSGDRYQVMEFESKGVEFDPRDNTDSFLRISIGGDKDETDIAPFWSVDSPEDIINMFNEVARRFGMSCRWKLEKYHVRPVCDLVREEIIPEDENETNAKNYDEARKAEIEKNREKYFKGDE